MATTIMLPDGKVETVFDLADMLRLIEDRMGWEARELLEEWIRPDSDAEDYIAYLEKEVEAQKARRLLSLLPRLPHGRPGPKEGGAHTDQGSPLPDGILVIPAHPH